MILFETDKKPLTFLLDQIENRELALPDFQRSFVWDPGATRELIVSILQSFPAGTLLLMQGGSKIFAPRAVEEAPDLAADPSYLVLDGQQRLTSLYQAFAGRGTHRFFVNLRELIDGEDLDEAVEVYTERNALRWEGMAEQASDLMLPLSKIREFPYWKSNILAEYAKAGQETQKLDLALIEQEQQVLKNAERYHFPVTTLASTTPTEAVCSIFETLNRTGVKLSPFELITARAFASEVNLRDMWKLALEANPIIEEFDIDPYYVLQVIAVTAKASAKRSAVLGLEVSAIVDGWEAAIQGLAGSLALLRTKCGVLSKQWLPYNTMVITMAAVWRHVTDQKGPAIGARLDKLAKWFWCSSFAGSYENAPNTQTERDVRELATWFTSDEAPEVVYGFTFDPARWREITPRQRAQYRATINLIVQQGPRDFHQATPIDHALVEAIGIDDHHVFPRRYLAASGQQIGADTVLNHTLIDRKTNIRISDKAPSTYLAEMKQEMSGTLDDILASHLLPHDQGGPLWNDRYADFLEAREGLLAAALRSVTGIEDLTLQKPPRAKQAPAAAAAPGDLPLRVRQLVDARAKSPEVKGFALELIEELAALPGVITKAGSSSQRADGLGRAVQLHRVGSRKGAFAYVNPRGRVILRLPDLVLDGREHAHLRSVKPGDPYKVAVPLLRAEHVEEAREMLHEAYHVAGEASASREPFDWTTLHRILAGVPRGRWTTYGDLARVVGTAAQPLGRHVMACNECSYPYRVLGVGGRPRPNFAWTDPTDRRTQEQVLEEEGISFVGGRAAGTLRMSIPELRALHEDG